MGASFYWHPVKPGKSLPVNAPSSFREALEELFGKFPLTLSTEDVPELKGLRAGNKNEREAIDAILNAIERHGSIQMEVGY